MAITTVPSVITGQTYSAANFNTHIRDNINGIWVLTTAGDMLYATGASAAARLALVPGGVMVGGASAPEWLANQQYGLLHGGASEPDWLSVGAIHTFLKSEGVDVKYGSLVYKRVGNSSTNWQDPGSTTYTPTKTLIQAGIVSVSYNPYGSTTVTYPQAYTYRPLLFITVNAGYMVPGYADDSTTQFKASAYHTLGYSGSIAVAWLAIGE